MSSSLRRCFCGRCYRWLAHCYCFSRNWLSIVHIVHPSFFITDSLQFAYQSAENANSAELTNGLLSIVTSFIVIFFICEFGEMVCNRFNSYNEELCKCDWHAFPVEIQQLLLIFMTSTQRPAAFQGYGGIECTRDTFKKVRH